MMSGERRVGAVEAALALFRIDPCPRTFSWKRDAVGFYDYHFVAYAAASIFYVPLTFLGVRLMRHRGPAPIPAWVLAAWNGFWSVFSAACFVDLARLLAGSTLSWHQSICTDDEMSTASSIAQYAMRARFLFVIAKIAELGDTAFIVLRKRPLILLHYWHHETVLLFTWQMAQLQSEGGDGTYYTLMNAFVHMIMYGYYSLSGVFGGVRKVPFLPQAITFLQIAQMALAMGLLGYRTAHCNTKNTQNLAFGWLIYASYFVLFIHYFAQRYRPRPAVEQTAKAKAE